MTDDFQTALTTMAEAINCAHAGHAQWFSIYFENLIYKPLFGKSARQLHALYGLHRNASLCATLPEEARFAMMERMTFITEHLRAGQIYGQIKELVLAELACQPLELPAIPTPKPSTRSSRPRPPRSGNRMTGQLCLPGFDDEHRE